MLYEVITPDVLRLVAGHLDFRTVGRIVQVHVDAFDLAHRCFECLHVSLPGIADPPLDAAPATFSGMLFLEAKLLYHRMNTAFIFMRLRGSQLAEWIRGRIIHAFVGPAVELLDEVVLDGLEKPGVGQQIEPGCCQDLCCMDGRLLANAHAVTGGTSPLMRGDMPRPGAVHRAHGRYLPAHIADVR